MTYPQYSISNAGTGWALMLAGGSRLLIVAKTKKGILAEAKRYLEEKANKAGREITVAVIEGNDGAPVTENYLTFRPRREAKK